MKRTVKKVVSKTLHTLPFTGAYLREKQRLYETAQQQALHIKFLEDQHRHAHTKTFNVVNGPCVRFITNQLDSTGAPLIFIDVIRDFALRHPSTPIDLHSFEPANREYIKNMQEIGIESFVHENRDIALKFVKNDVVVLNTVAYSDTFKESIYDALDAGTVKKLIWYIHEDWPHIFFREEERLRLKSLIANDKISIFCPATQATENIQNFFELKKNISVLPYRLHVDEVYHRKKRTPEEYKKLKFVMVGKTGEGLKGHLPILYAFLTFKKMYYDKNPKKYRDFELNFIAIEADYLSLQIKNHSKALGNRLHIYEPLPHETALEKIQESNVTICYSLRECLPVFVFEGMMAAHIILRNDVSGRKEQLKDGKNGFLLENNDYEQVVETIEKILNTSTTSDEKLSEMSRVSYEIASKYLDNNYEVLMHEINSNFVG